MPRHRVTASQSSVPLPAWAYQQRSLLEFLSQAADIYEARYADERGWLIWRNHWDQGFQNRDGVDDFYEAFYNFPVVYLLGGDDKFIQLAKKHWSGITEQLTALGMLHKGYERGYDQFHQSEGYLFFYYLCMAQPDDPILQEQAVRFAGFFLNEDSDAINYDPVHHIMLAPHNGSEGPRSGYFDDTPIYPYTESMRPYGLPYHDLEGINTFDDLKDPINARRMGEAMQVRMGRGDVATNLFVTSLVANAYLMSTDPERRLNYQQWIMDYVDAWKERAHANGGLIPDNVGVNGRIGEEIGGRWYGGLYGWTWPHGWYNISYAVAIASINRLIVTGDLNSLDFIRSQYQQMLKRLELRSVDFEAMTLRAHFPNHLHDLPDKPIWQIPYRYRDQGWFDYHPLSAIIPANLWSISGDAADRAQIDWLRAHSHYDWTQTLLFRTKEDSGHEEAWITYLRGENPHYPETILHTSVQVIAERVTRILADDADLHQVHIHHWQLHNPITTEALIQQILGIPQPIYYGGLIVAPIFYLDLDGQRPGLPADVAALVEAREGTAIQIQIVNLSPIETHRLLLVAGSLAQHEFHIIEVSNPTNPAEKLEGIDVSDRQIEVVMPPLSTIRLRCQLRQYVYPATYIRAADFCGSDEGLSN